MELVINVLVFAVLIAVGGGIGRFRERRHIRDLDARERLHAGMVVTNTRVLPAGYTEAGGGALVTGAVVIANDYLKTFIAKIRSLLGGELRSYQTLLLRARREARLRMLEDAKRLGASAVINLRYETSMIGNTRGRSAMPTTEILCFGTAVLPRRG